MTAPRPPEAIRRPGPARRPSVSETLKQACAHHGAGRLHEAATGYVRVLDAEAGNADALHLLGMVMRSMGRPEDAAKMIERAIAARPGFPDAHGNLGAVRLALGDGRGARAAFERAVALDPGNARYHGLLGQACRAVGDPAAAVEALRAAIRLDPDNAETWHALADAVQAMGERDIAIDIYRRAVTLRPDRATAHYDLALALLAAGDLAGGLAEYEWRAEALPAAGGRDLGRPPWDSRLYTDRTLLVHTEADLGETFQFCRYLPQAARRGGRLILECAPELVPLFRPLPWLARVVAADEPLPPFDIQVPLPSLPHVLGTTRTTIPPAVQALTPEPHRMAAWRDRLGPGNGLRVGLIWAGVPRHGEGDGRSMPLAEMLVLPMVPQVSYYSLQGGRATPELLGLGLGRVVGDLGGDVVDFADLAALVSVLDLIITVDCPAAHLAGALNRPLWVLLPESPDWHWLAGEDDGSPWYPTARLYRQARPGDWAGVMARVAADLAAVAATGG